MSINNSLNLLNNGSFSYYKYFNIRCSKNIRSPYIFFYLLWLLRIEILTIRVQCLLYFELFPSFIVNKNCNIQGVPKIEISVKIFKLLTKKKYYPIMELESMNNTSYIYLFIHRHIIRYNIQLLYNKN